MRRIVLLFALFLAACGDGPAPSSIPILFLGLDGADWQLLDAYMASGVMPNLAALAREGRTGVLETIHPPLSPLVWTTMMTGVSPLEHGILDFTRRSPVTGALEPITTAERQAPAVWNMAGDRGKSVAVFGLWATWPAEPVKGLMVADRFLSFTSRDREPPPGSVHPTAQESWAREGLAKAEREVGFEALRAYLPWLDLAGYEEALAEPDPYAHPVSALRRILVETRAYHALASAWLKRERPDLAVVYFQGTDTLGHVFAPFAPPRQRSVSPEDFERFSRVPGRYFAEVDALLGEYRKLAEASGAVLMIASDHGFRWQEGRPETLSSAAAATAGRWHRDEGIFLLWGPGIESSPERGRGNVGQVCATLLALAGLPPGKGLAGPPLAGVRAATGPAVDYRASYRLSGVAPEGAGSEEEIAKLRALGYLGSREGSPSPSGETRTAASYNNEGLLQRERGDMAAAERAFGRALATDPGNVSAMWNLSDLLHSQGRDPDRSDELLLTAFSGGLPDGASLLAARSLELSRRGDAEGSLRLLGRALAAQPHAAPLLLLRGRQHMDRQRCREALADFDAAARTDPGNALVHASAGLARLCLGDAEGAARSLRKSLEIDPDQPEIRKALGALMNTM